MGKNQKKQEKSNFDFRIPIWIVENLFNGQRIIHVKSSPPVIIHTAVICNNSKYSEKFKLRISNIRIVVNLFHKIQTSNFEYSNSGIIHVKSSSPVIIHTAVICNNSKYLEKFKLRSSNIRIMEDHSYPLRFTHAKY